MECAVGWHALWLRYAGQWNTGWHELTNAALQMHTNAVGLRKGNKAIDIDIADIAGLPIENGTPVFCRRSPVPIWQRKRAPRIGHEFVDDQLSFARNSIHDGINAD